METAGGEKLRDFLGIQQDNNMNRNTGGGMNNLTGLTLNAVLSDRRLPSAGPEVSPQRIQSFRTLLDIIQEDQAFNNAHMKDSKKSWKSFKGKLRLRLGDSGSGSSWTSSMRMPTSEIPVNRPNNPNVRNTTSDRVFTSRASAGLPYSDQSTQPDISAVPDVDRDLMSYPRGRSSPSLQWYMSRAVGRTSDGFDDTNPLSMTRARENEEGEAAPTEEAVADAEEGEGANGEEEEMANEEGGGEQQPVRMSLMALLAETDKEMGLGGPAHSTDDEEEEDSSAGVEYNNCCVCMVRHKGAAFIPCGHTFCRLCCRELLVQRGSCPLCNNYIVEILDIF
ncbi:LON peptidase N-terminal domain and RING finger protein 3-like [Forsythia ovata]|uniref:LON peptidase N-terminal domain and RING finger protein 3-like n=1 Tax=Forsythia ovata TaxID=205694 RepID=A0ABD1T5P3_9LAMI